MRLCRPLPSAAAGSAADVIVQFVNPVRSSVLAASVQREPCNMQHPQSWAGPRACGAAVRRGGAVVQVDKLALLTFSEPQEASLSRNATATLTPPPLHPHLPLPTRPAFTSSHPGRPENTRTGARTNKQPNKRARAFGRAHTRSHAHTHTQIARARTDGRTRR